MINMVIKKKYSKQKQYLYFQIGEFGDDESDILNGRGED